MLGLLLANWRLIAVGIAMAALAAFAAVQHTRLQWTQAEFAQFRANVEREAAAARVRNAQEAARRAQEAQEALDALQNRYAALNARYGRLRAGSSGGGVPDLAAAAPIFSAGCPKPLEPDPAARFLAELEKGLAGIMEEGDREIAKYVQLWGLARRNANRPDGAP